MTFSRKYRSIKQYVLSFSFYQRTSTTLCFYVSLLTLFVQVLVFLMLLYSFDDEMPFNDLFNNKCSIMIYDDLKSLTFIASEMGISFIPLDNVLLNAEKKLVKNIKLNCIYCHLCKPVIVALDDSATAEKRKQLLEKLIDQDFMPVTFYNIHPAQSVHDLNNVETAIFLKRTVTFQIVILYPREDNTWWFGDIRNDPSYTLKLSSFNLTLEHIDLMKTEGVIDRFELIPSTPDNGLVMMFPKDASSLLADLSNSRFIECNQTRATLFHRQFGSDRSAEALRFRHKAWKMLSRVKTVLDSLGIAFWLSSGTVLGYFRECDVIAHSKDVDIGVWASEYTDRIISEMHNHGFHLKISLGFPNDSLELSFTDTSGIKLDIFFFYEDELNYWNGGTQVKSGKKFKYSFPKFTLCWTLFKDLRLRIPCETEAYIKANYGPNWITPVKTWDWKTSPFNVKPNGFWKTDQLPEAVKTFV